MSFSEIKRREIKNYLLHKIDEDDDAVIAKVADAFGISATSVRRYIDAEIADGHIMADDSKKSGYSLIFKNHSFEYNIKDMDEHDDNVLYTDIYPILSVNENAGRIWKYALPEMFNNAIEHSQGKRLKTHVEACCLYTRIAVSDNGIGIFKNVVNAMKDYGFKNPTPEDAIIELYKGKFTSCPERHTGEGIFFTMRMVDKLSIVSDGTILEHGYYGDVSYIKSHLLAYAMKLSKTGTVVIMELNNNTQRSSREIFDQYADIDEGLIRTSIPVFEACLDRDPVARSQARRIAHRLEGFKEVTLDFSRVEIMGQGFADELFRVFKNAHPDTILTPVNMNSDVQMMYLYSVNKKVEAPRYK